MFARIVTYTADPSPPYTAVPPPYLGEQGLRLVREKALPRLRQLDGFEGAYFFVDRQSSKAISITLWESEEAMHRSEEVLRPLRAEIARALAANRVDVEHYEVSTRAGAIHERELVKQELRVAHRIQQASLPRAVPKLEGWEITHHYQPARQVGGDFYDFHPLSDGKLGLIIGDATGKGVPAALVMATTCGMLRAVAQSADYSPGAVLERVNEALCPNIAANMFVTSFYAILDPKSGRLLYANAGHNLPCCRHEHAARELRARGMPLGLMPGMSYEEKETILEAGEAALFYSDGLVEAHDPKGEMFGFPRLRTLIAEHGEERSLGDFLMEELYSFVGESWEQEDDITLLTLERSTT